MWNVEYRVRGTIYTASPILGNLALKWLFPYKLILSQTHLYLMSYVNLVPAIAEVPSARIGRIPSSLERGLNYQNWLFWGYFSTFVQQFQLSHVYVLWSVSQRKFYVGYTADLDRRLSEHEQGKCHTTQRLNNPDLIFYEAFKNEYDARRREEYFKTTKGKKTLKLMLHKTLCPVV